MEISNFKGKLTGKNIVENIVSKDYELVDEEDINMDRLRRQ